VAADDRVTFIEPLICCAPDQAPSAAQEAAEAADHVNVAL
jgi:hypothetical protein